MADNPPTSKRLLAEVKTRIERETKNWDAGHFGKDLFEQTGECIFIIGMDLCYLAANQHALNLLGYEEAEMLGMHVSNVVSIGDLLDPESVTGDHANIYERILKKKDGTVIPVEISTSLVYAEDGQPHYIQSIVRDISSRKAAERLIQRNSRILSAISEATVRLFRYSNIESGITEVLESLGAVLGTFCCMIFDIEQFSDTPQVMIQYSWTHPSAANFDPEKAVKPFIPRLLHAPDTILTQTNIQASRVVQDFSFLAVPIHGGTELRGFLGLFDRGENFSWLLSEFDVIQTASNLVGAALERIQYEETIRLNEFRNRMIVESFPDLLVRVNADGEILDYNASLNHPLYIHRDMITGRKLTETWPESVVAKILGEENRGVFKADHWLEGFQLPFSSSIYESRLHPINLGEALIIVRDITDMVRLNEMKTDFINRASHELRTPLTAVILMADLIQQGGTQEELDEYWRTMRNELNRQKKLIDSLLMAGRLESGTVKLDVTLLDLLPVVQDSILAVKPIAGMKYIEVVLEAPPGPVNVMGDAAALQQVFINLITNAVKFSPEESRVLVTVGYSEGYVDVSVIDSGMGISEDAIPHLFEKFYRARNVTVAEIPGSGIGLYIVKSIVEELGGSIEVSSRINKGTTFTVHIKPVI